MTTRLQSVCITLVLLAATLPPIAYAFPSTVTSAYTNCDGGTAGCNVDSADVTLSVDSMTANANTAGNSTAVFMTTNMGFAYALRIDMTTGSPWSHGANLLVRIINAKTISATRYFLYFLGPLQLGSVVSVEGGSFVSPLPFTSILFFAATSGVFGGSTVSIVSATFVTSNAMGNTLYTPLLVAYSVSTSFQIAGSSAFIMKHISWQLSQVSTVAAEQIALVFFHADMSVIISDNSNFVMDNNTMVMAISSQPGYFTQFHGFHTGGQLVVTGSSNVTITNLHQSVTNSAFQGTLQWSTVWARYLLLNGTSTIRVNSNTAVASDVSVAGEIWWNHVNFTNSDTPSMVDGDSTFEVSNNSLVARHVSHAGYIWSWQFLFPQSSFSVTQASTLSANGNSFLIDSCSSGYLLYWSLLYLPYGVLIGGGSTIEMRHTTFLISGLSTTSSGFLYYRLLFLVTSGYSIDVLDDSALVLDGCTSVVTGLSMTTVYWASLYTTTTGTINLNNGTLTVSNYNFNISKSVLSTFVWEVVQVFGPTKVANHSTVSFCLNTLDAHQYDVSYNNWVVIYVSRGVHASQESFVNVSGNLVNFTDMSVTGPMSNHLIYSPSATVIGDFSTLFISGNTFIVARVGITPQLYMPNVVLAGSSSVVNFSTVVVEKAAFDYQDIVSGLTGGWTTTPDLLQVGPGLTISNNSAFLVRSCAYSSRNYSNVGGGISMRTWGGGSGLLSVSLNSILNITGISHSFSNTTLSTILNAMLLDSPGSISVTEGSSIILASNEWHFSNMTFTSTLSWNAVDAGTGTITVTPGSNFSISNHNYSMQTTSLVTNTWQGLLCGVLNLAGGGALGITDNSITMSNVVPSSSTAGSNVAIISVTSDLQISNGLLSVLRNAMPDLVAPTSLWKIAASSPANIRTCANIVGGTLCKMSRYGSFTCLPVNPTVRARDCRGTDTMSLTYPFTATSTAPHTTTYSLTVDSGTASVSEAATRTKSLFVTSSRTKTPSIGSSSHSLPSSVTALVSATPSKRATHTLIQSISTSVALTSTQPGATITRPGATSTHVATHSPSPTPTATPPHASPSPSATPSMASSVTGNFSATVSPPPSLSNTPPLTATASRTASTSPPNTSTSTPTHTAPRRIATSSKTSSEGSASTSQKPSASRRGVSSTLTPPPPTLAPCNISDLQSRLPLFDSTSVNEAAIRRGLSQLLPVHLPPLDAAIVALSNATSGFPITQMSVLRISVAGNLNGFAAKLPLARVFVVNGSFVRLELSPLADYTIAEGESLELLTSVSTVAGPTCLIPGTQPLLLVGSITVSTDKSANNPTSTGGTAVGGGVGVVGIVANAALAGEQVGLGALALFSCADPETRLSFGSYRLLSPFAIFESYAGVVLGNAISIGVVGVVQVGILLALKLYRSARRWIEQMASARFPSLLVGTALAFHSGTAFASSQLISQPSDFALWEVIVGSVGFAYSVAFPILLALHPYLRVERAYQAYGLDEGFASRLPRAAIKCMPEGAMYSPETRRAYGVYISFRAPATQVWWTSFPAWTASVIGVGGLLHPSSVAGCQILFAVMGFVLIVIAAAVMWWRPHRSHAASILDGVSKAILAGVLFAMVATLDPTTALSAQEAIRALGITLMALTLARLVLACACFIFDYNMVSDEVPLKTVWSHIPDEDKRMTHTFERMEDVEDVAAQRDTTDVAHNPKDSLNGGPSTTLADFEVEMVDDISISSTESTDHLSSSEHSEVTPSSATTPPLEGPLSSPTSARSNSTLSLSDRPSLSRSSGRSSSDNNTRSTDTDDELL